MLCVLIIFSCNQNQKKIQGIWIVDSGINKNDTVSLINEKVLYNFSSQEFDVIKFNPNPHLLFDSIRGGKYSIDKNLFDSNLYLQSPKASFEFSNSSLIITTGELKLCLKRLNILNKGQKSVEIREMLENNLFRFNQSKVYFEFHNDGTFLTNQIEPFDWLERWSCISFGNEIFFNIENSHFPLFQISKINIDSILLVPAYGESENYKLSFESIKPKFKKEKLIGMWRVTSSEFEESDYETKLDSIGIKVEDLINISPEFVSHNAKNSFVNRRWELSKSGELLYFRNELDLNENIQWNILELQTDYLKFKQVVRDRMTIGTRIVIAKRE